MLLELSILSNALQMNTQVNVILPEGGEPPRKILWLLHGLKGDHTSWLRNTSIERYAMKYHLAVVMPDAARSWYTDTAYGAKYFSYIADELPSLCRRVFQGWSEASEDNIVAGLSMGGYGALKLALSRPEQYGSCITLSGALDITRKGRPYVLDEWRSIFGYGLESALDLEGSEHDLFALTERNRKQGLPFPKLYLWCGTEDTLITVNRAYAQRLTDLGIAHTYEESEGTHKWVFWDLHIQDGLKNILKNE